MHITTLDSLVILLKSLTSDNHCHAIVIFLIIDREAREIMHLVASVRLSVPLSVRL